MPVKEENCYECSVTRWKSWVEDNYDWEGDKEFGPEYFHFIRPTQREMNELAKYGCAKSYQRSSKSWTNPVDDIQPWKECFQDGAELDRNAEYRRDLIEDRERARREEAADGALPSPGPAEDQLGK